MKALATSFALKGFVQNNYTVLCCFFKALLRKRKVTMRKFHKDILQKHFQDLVEDVNPDPVMRHLFSKGIISKEDMEAIRSKGTSTEKNEDLLLRLMKKGHDAFKMFVEGLQKDQSPLAETLKDEGNESIFVILLEFFFQQRAPSLDT